MLSVGRTDALADATLHRYEAQFAVARFIGRFRFDLLGYLVDGFDSPATTRYAKISRR